MSRCDLCLVEAAPYRLGSEITNPAGEEHASGRLRRGSITA